MGQNDQDGEKVQQIPLFDKTLFYPGVGAIIWPPPQTVVLKTGFQLRRQPNIGEFNRLTDSLAALYSLTK